MTVRYHEGQQEYYSSYLVQRWQMHVDQVFLFEMLEQLDHRVLQNVDDAAQAPWRPTRSCRSSMKARVRAGICALGHTYICLTMSNEHAHKYVTKLLVILQFVFYQNNNKNYIYFFNEKSAILDLFWSPGWFFDFTIKTRMGGMYHS